MPMDDMRIGAAFRAVRIRRGWRQEDVAALAGVSRAFVSTVERGQLESTSLRMLRMLARALEIRLDVYPRWRGGELDRLLNARHAAMHESMATKFAGLSGWATAPEVSFSVYGERGVVDILAFHAASGCLLVIELKTAVIDIHELISGPDRKARLAPRMATDLGWNPTSVSRWLVVADGRTNRRRLAEHRNVLRAAFPADGRTMAAWLANPSAPIRAMSLWPIATPRSTRQTSGPRRGIRRP